VDITSNPSALVCFKDGIGLSLQIISCQIPILVENSSLTEYRSSAAFPRMISKHHALNCMEIPERETGIGDETKRERKYYLKLIKSIFSLKRLQNVIIY
jgi:hypothetical protein